MESGYDGLVAAQANATARKIEVQMIENISNADMEQALTQLALGNTLVIGVGGQTQAAVYAVAALPRRRVLDRRRQRRARSCRTSPATT